jgi:hypothetical protein
VAVVDGRPAADSSRRNVLNRLRPRETREQILVSVGLDSLLAVYIAKLEQISRSRNYEYTQIRLNLN